MPGSPYEASVAGPIFLRAVDELVVGLVEAGVKLAAEHPELRRVLPD